MSAAPSTRPTNVGPAPRASTRKTGISGKIISVPMSVKRLVKPSRTTVAGRRARAPARVAARDICSSIPRARLARVSVALFIRHGKASAFAATDYDQLSPPGVEQSEQLGEWLARQKLHVDAVFVGPRKRHAQTHEAVTRVLATHGLSLPAPAMLPELDEHDGLAVVFKLLPQLAAEDPALAVDRRGDRQGRCPRRRTTSSRRSSASRGAGCGARSGTTRWSRGRRSARASRRALPRIAAIGRGKTALVFTSAGAVASAVADALGVGEEERVLDLSWSLYNGSITELDFTDDRWGLRTFNTTAHLDRRLVTSV